MLMLLAVLAIAAPVQAEFLVEAHSSGLANANFAFGGDTTTASASIPSEAIGLTATNSLYSGDGVNFGDTYVYSYTPGTDADNLTIPIWATEIWPRACRVAVAVSTMSISPGRPRRM